MDLGLAFDDDDLQNFKKKIDDISALPYHVKIVQPEWFESAFDVQGLHGWTEIETEQVPHAYKMSGDFHYYKQNYRKASEQYQNALDLLPENNVSVRQDLIESLSRCYMYIGQTEESLHLARNLVHDLSKEDEAHQRQSLILLSSVCAKAGLWAEFVNCLEKLCCLQPYYAQFWSQLGDAYANLLNEIQMRHDDADDPTPLDCQIRQLTCYTRAKLLHKSVNGTASSLVRLRNMNLIRELEKKIACAPFPEREKTLAVEFIQQEFENQATNIKESNSEVLEICIPVHESTDDESKLSQSQLFYQRFCTWFTKDKVG
ncbi:unnamed protein product [Lymnaea stagnalis]|uniref:Uncharacterized protein n=1 Tax=Lymnaea stagnalis TaxID=6523 RepID=A0AAV2HT39_LYMST